MFWKDSHQVFLFIFGWKIKKTCFSFWCFIDFFNSLFSPPSKLTFLLFNINFILNYWIFDLLSTYPQLLDLRLALRLHPQLLGFNLLYDFILQLLVLRLAQQLHPQLLDLRLALRLHPQLLGLQLAQQLHLNCWVFQLALDFILNYWIFDLLYDFILNYWIFDCSTTSSSITGSSTCSTTSSSITGSRLAQQHPQLDLTCSKHPQLLGFNLLNNFILNYWIFDLLNNYPQLLELDLV